MISTTFIQENHLRIQLPAASARAQQPSAELEIVIDARGNYFVDGNKLINQDASTIADALEILRPASDDPTLLISADASAEHRHVVKVMDVAGRILTSTLLHLNALILFVINLKLHTTAFYF